VIGYRLWASVEKIAGAIVLVCMLGQGVHAEQSGPPEFDPTPVSEPGPGSLLVASREMPDSRFKNAVILLLEHGREGSLGLIVNRPTRIGLPEVLSELEGAAEQMVFFGGPVAVHEPIFLVRGAPLSGSANHITGDWYWSDGRGVLGWLLDHAEPPEDWRVYLGHAGWAPGQLDVEVATGSWRLFQLDPGVLFQQDLNGLWEAFMKKPRWIMAGI
jgi:putative transcriptional regulator